ncbi:MAG: exopolysaccharide biosynthesis protein [Pseudomonadota bacterium]|nr:exopolysaccharide biosynthesis protein [Pseudomonadota bacterium]
MNQPDDPNNLQELLDRLRDGTDGQHRVSVGDIMNVVGERSFGPLALVAGVVTLAPLIGDIPGVPTILAFMVLLTLGQLLFQRESVWIPARLADRSLEQQKLDKGLDWLEKPARFLDRWTKPRLVFLVRGPGQYVMAVLCLLVAAAMPLMEIIPFSANGGGLALAAFGLAIIARDGLLALIAAMTTAGTAWFVLTNLPG